MQERIEEYIRKSNWKPSVKGNFYRLGSDPNETEPLWDDWFYDIDTWGEFGVREVFAMNYLRFDWWKEL